MTYLGHKNKGNDHNKETFDYYINSPCKHLWKCMVKVLRICILMLGFKGLDTTTYTCFLVGPSLIH